MNRTSNESAKNERRTPAETAMLFALSTFAGRIANTCDPEEHRKAGLQLQKDLRRVKILSDN